MKLNGEEEMGGGGDSIVQREKESGMRVSTHLPVWSQ